MNNYSSYPFYPMLVLEAITKKKKKKLQNDKSNSKLAEQNIEGTKGTSVHK